MNITVVGAGVIGCAIAHELASRGARVVLIDSRGIGRGATRASAGILAPHIEGHIPALRDLAACSLSLYDDFVRRIERDSQRVIEYNRSGTLQVALGDVEGAALAKDASVLTAAGVKCTMLDGVAVKRLEPNLSQRCAAGLVVPMHGYVAAASLTDALADAARARGVRVVTAAVRAIDGGTSPVRVTTDTEVLESDAVVVASGSWPVTTRPAEAPAIKPIRGQLVQLRSSDRVASRVIWGAACYLVPWKNGSVLVGATVEDVGFDEHATAEGVSGLLTAALALIPALSRAHFEDVRVGFRPRSGDELPIIGRSEMPHVFFAMGHYRNGVLLAPLTAAIMSDLILDGRERPELDLVRPERLARV